MIVVDWGELAGKLGTVYKTAGGWSEKGGTKVAGRALIAIVGDKAFRDAVDFYVLGTPGFETARSVLQLLSPPAAMERCMEIFRDGDEELAISAIELLRNIADRRALEWMPELLASEYTGVRAWSLGIIDQLHIMKGDIDRDEAMPFIEQALTDQDESVRRAAEQVVELIEHQDQADWRSFEASA